jgi:SnoaL-like domain
VSVETRLAELEDRIRTLEDELEIQRLLNRYGPLVDSGLGADAAALWTAGGTYEFQAGSTTKRLVAPADLEALYRGDFHEGLIATGCSHLTVAPVISVDGDRGQAVGYSYVIVNNGDTWTIARAAVNHWTLARDASGWRVERRVNRTLAGSPESHELLRGARHG